MIRGVAFAFGVLMAANAMAAEYPWSPAVRQCASAFWSVTAACAVGAYYRGTIPNPIRDTCINRVAHQSYWRGGLNPIDRIFFCVEGG